MSTRNLNSNEVWVFPSSRRGSKQASARYQQETTFTEIIQDLSDYSNGTFIITQPTYDIGSDRMWFNEDEPFEFMIHGYRFRIAKFSSILPNDSSGEGKSWIDVYAYISIDKFEIQNYSDDTDEDNFIEYKYELKGRDTTEGESEGIEIYTGLTLSDTIPAGDSNTHYLHLFNRETALHEWKVDQKSLYKYSSEYIELDIDGGIIRDTEESDFVIVKFDPNKEQQGQGSYQIELQRGEGFTFPTIEECGFTNKSPYLGFDYWSFLGQHYQPEDRIKEVFSNTTVMTYWKTANILITFAPGGGSGTMPKVYLAIGESYVLPECQFESKSRNYKFISWLAPDGTSYEPGKIYKPEGGIKEDIIFTATWKDAYRFIDLNANDGSGRKASEQYDINTTITIPACPFDPITLYQAFDYWENPITGEKLYPGDKITLTDDDISLNAIWKTVIAVNTVYYCITPDNHKPTREDFTTGEPIGPTELFEKGWTHLYDLLAGESDWYIGFGLLKEVLIGETLVKLKLKDIIQNGYSVINQFEANPTITPDKIEIWNTKEPIIGGQPITLNFIFEEDI